MKSISLFLYAVFFNVIMHSIAYAFPISFISIDAVTLFAEPGQTQSINLLNTLGNTYVHKKQWQHSESVILGAGIALYPHRDIEINTGVRYLPQVSLQTQGDVLQLHEERFRNLAYSYDINSSFWMADSTIIWTKHRLQPGIIFGVGAAWNTTSNYYEQPLNNHSTSSFGPFQNNHNIQFAYELGVALDYSFDKVIVECAYRYMDAGQSHLGLSPLQNTQAHLFTGPLHYNALSLGMRYYYEF